MVNAFAAHYNVCSDVKTVLPIRIIVADPLAGVRLRVQKGKDELINPISESWSKISFEFEVTVDITDGALNFLGKFAQGPKDSRFIYVNSGTYASQVGSCWSRRAKISLMGIGKDQVDRVLKGKDMLVETTMPGRGSDGGPTCASVKGIKWAVVRR